MWRPRHESATSTLVGAKANIRKGHRVGANSGISRQALQGPEQAATTGSVHVLQRQNRPSGQSQEATGGYAKCYRCGGGKHTPQDCHFKEADCNNCGKTGHLARVCRSKPKQGGQRQPRHRQPTKKTHHLAEEAAPEHTPAVEEYCLYHVDHKQSSTQPMCVTVEANEADLSMEVDTGAAASVISEANYKRVWRDVPEPPQLRPTTTNLQTYTGEKLRVLGTITVDVSYNEQRARLSLLAIEGAGPTLMGRDWLNKLTLDWKQLNRLHTRTLQEVVENHADFFKDELGLAKHVKAKIHVDLDAPPRFHRPRPVPYALRPKVEEELKRLEKEGVIEPVQFADWAAPIVPIVKQDGTVRICGDYKVTVNRASKLDTYPLPRVEDLFAALGNGKSFTKLELAHAFQQIKLDEASRDLTVINTHRGLYRYNRLPFGVSSAPAIFQRIMEGILQGIPNVAVYIDDILVTGKTDEEHLESGHTGQSPHRLQERRLKKRKCELMRPSVEYLGHIISAEGLRPTQEKVRTINDAPAPQNVTQLRSYLGLVNFYSKFLPNLSTLLAPLYHLLQKEVKWHGAVKQLRRKRSKKQRHSCHRQPCWLSFC